MRAPAAGLTLTITIGTSRVKAFARCWDEKRTWRSSAARRPWAEALAIRFDPDVIVAGVVLPGSRRHEIIGTLRARFPSAAILILTAACTPEDI